MDDWRLQLAMTLAGVVAAKALDELVGAAKRLRRKKKTPKKPSKRSKSSKRS